MKTDLWIGKIDAITNSFKTTFGGVSADQLNWKPNSQVWSIAQNIDHLIIINNTYYSIPDQIRKDTYPLPWIARFNFIVNFFGNIILDSVEPSRRKKIKTFPIWQPSQSPLPPDIVERFSSEQGKLKKFILDNTDLVELQTVISSPANKTIVYKLETAFDIIITHEQRHFEQAKEVLTLLNKTSQ